MPRKIEISCRTIVFAGFLLLVLAFLYQIRQILTIFFVAFVLMSALNPWVDKLEQRRVPRALAIFLIYFFIIGLIGFSLASILPSLVDQTTGLILHFPDYLQLVGIREIDPLVISSQINQLGSIPANVFKVAVGIFSNVIGFFFLAVTTFYFLLERKRRDRYLTVYLGKARTVKVGALIDQIERRLGGWVRAELTLMLIIGLMSYLGLVLLGVNFALPLAILAGLLEVVPNIGPIISAVPAILAGLAISPITGVATMALYFLIHQLENSLVTPQVMRREVGVNPLITIFALAAGFEVGRIAGAVLAIPLLLVVQSVWREFFPSIFPENP